MSSPTRDVAGLAGLLVVAGLGHFVRPEPFEAIVPKALPCKRELVYASGAAELACAAGLLGDRSRRAAGVATAALMVAVFPANVQMAMSVIGSSRAPRWYKAGTVLRLPLQLPLLTTALKAARGDGSR